MLKKFHLKTKKDDAIKITDQVIQTIDESNVSEGICTISVPHTTAGLIITSFGIRKGWKTFKMSFNV